MTVDQKPTKLNIGALKLAKANLRAYQEGIENDEANYKEVGEIILCLDDIIERAEA